MDRKEFNARLRDLTKDQVVLIGARATVRVFPVVTRSAEDIQRRETLALLTARAILTSGVAVKMPTLGVRQAADAAADAADRASAARANAATHAARAAGAAARGCADPTANAADAAACDNAADFAVDAATFADQAAHAAAHPNAAPYEVGDAATHAVNPASIKDLSLPIDTLWSTPVWHKPGEPDWLIDVLSDRDDTLNAGPEWAFWRKWYQGFLNGAHLDWELQRRVALIEEEIWRAGPEAVADRILEIEQELRDEQLLSAAQAQSQAKSLLARSAQTAVTAKGLDELVATAVTAYKREISNALPEALEPLEYLQLLLGRIAITLSGDLNVSEKEQQLIKLIQEMAHTIAVLNTRLIEAKNEISVLNAKSDAGSPKRLFADAFYKKAGEGAAGLITSKILWGGLISGSVLLLGADAEALTDGLSNCFQSVIAPEPPD